jgi:glucokinase
MAVLYQLVGDSGSGVVMDANWRVEADVALLEHLARPLVQVFCDVAPALAQQRLVARVKSGERHPVHRDAMDPEVLASMLEQAEEPGQPLPLTGPVLRLDTSGTVDVSAVARWVVSHQRGLG